MVKSLVELEAAFREHYPQKASEKTVTQESENSKEVKRFRQERRPISGVRDSQDIKPKRKRRPVSGARDSRDIKPKKERKPVSDVRDSRDIKQKKERKLVSEVKDLRDIKKKAVEDVKVLTEKLKRILDEERQNTETYGTGTTRRR